MKSFYPFYGFVIAVFLLGGTATDALAKDRKPKGVKKAVATIRGCSDSSITGKAVFKEGRTEEGIKEVDVSLFVKGLSDGKHGVHIHEVAACEPCSAAKGHHDPGPNSNSDPDQPLFNHPYHMGDLINVEVHDGLGVMHTTTNRITLSEGRLSIFDDGEDPGSAIIIHTNEDTYCDQNDELVGGCAGGPRDACGIIEPIRKFRR